MKKIRVRFAPSPTGYLHIGGLRTALYNYLLARKEGGVNILRIEDTDQTRYVEGAIEALQESTKWAGIEYDEGPFIQSQRLPIYKKYADELIEKGLAYYCFCDKDRLEHLREEQKAKGETPRYDGHCRDIPLEEAKRRIAAGEDYVIRMKLPANTEIKFHDVIKGDVSINTDDMDDQVLMKSDGYPTYHMAVVVDDNDMGVTHVLRGDEWLTSTPKHIFLYDAFGWEKPEFVHLPVILGSNKKKLSKRDGDVSVQDFQKKGYLPEALVNYIALVGWSPADGSEKMTMAEMIEKFSLDRISHSGGVFSLDKLRWFNNQYIREADPERLLALAKPFFIEAGYCSEPEFEANKNHYALIMESLKERIGALSDIADFKDYFSSDTIGFDSDEAAEVLKSDDAKAVIAKFAELLQAKVDEAKEAGGSYKISAEDFKAMLKQVTKETGAKGKGLYMPVRVATTGEMHGPDMAITSQILGAELMIRRIKQHM